MSGDYENLICLFAEHTQQCATKEEQGDIAKHFLGDYHRGIERKMAFIRKLVDMRNKYSNEPAIRGIPVQEHVRWGNMILRYAKGESAKAQNARTPLREHEFEMSGGLFIRKTGRKIHQKLKEQRKKLARPEDMTNNVFPHKTV